MEKNKKNNFLTSIRKSSNLGIFIALVVMIIIFTALKSNYLSKANILNILVSCSVVGLVAIGETYLMIAGQIDMSCGSISAFSGVFIAVLLKAGWPVIPSILLVMAVGAMIGLINALLVTRLEISFFIATLATQSIFRGLAYIICGGKSIAVSHAAFLKIGSTRLFGISLPVYIFLILVIVFGVILARTRFGRSIYMVGGNSNAARLAGIQSKKVITILFILSSLMAAMGGIILASRMNSGQPSASEGLEFDAVTGCVLGGVAMSGGIGNMTGAFIGLMIMQGFSNGLSVLNVQSFWQKVAKGLLLIVALTFDYVRNQQRKREALKLLSER
ncbi:MAG: ABC transporter permease [Candidatus Limivivens sp.]|nr:ABC transporter permease [Candidatus Limivivens sp.]